MVLAGGGLGHADGWWLRVSNSSLTVLFHLLKLPIVHSSPTGPSGVQA